jgi:hypothetical protein
MKWTMYGLRIALVLAAVCGPWLGVGTAPGQDIKPGIGKWDHESGLGNHRVVVRVEAPVPSTSPLSKKGAGRATGSPSIARPAVVQVLIPWRRRDAEPEKKNVIVIDASTGERIRNVLALAVTKETGFLLFEPQTVPGDYCVYFMPYKSEGRKNYPNVKYDLPEVTADKGWTRPRSASCVTNTRWAESP